MQISKRDFLKKLGLLGAAGVSGAADETLWRRPTPGPPQAGCP